MFVAIRIRIDNSSKEKKQKWKSNLNQLDAIKK